MIDGNLEKKNLFNWFDGVGKTSIIIRYTQGTFSNSYLMTLGVDFYEIEKKILQNNKEIDLSLVVWDIASQKNLKRYGATTCNMQI